MLRRALPLALPLVLLAQPLLGQSARDVMEDAMSRYAERMEGIDSYTVTQSVMGMETTMTFNREESPDGQVTFVPDMSQMGQGAASGQQYDSNYFMKDDFVDRMRVDGTEVVDGHETHVLVIDDFTDLDLSDFSSGENRFEPESIRMYMDTDEFIPRRMDMAGSTNMGGNATQMSTTVLMKDYQEVDGMLYPFLMQINTEGLGEAMGTAMDGGMSEAQKAQMEEAMAQMEAELEKLPESQRAMVRRMMEAQMEGGMAEMMDQAMREMEVRTLSLTVNSSPPAGM